MTGFRGAEASPILTLGLEVDGGKPNQTAGVRGRRMTHCPCWGMGGWGRVKYPQTNHRDHIQRHVNGHSSRIVAPVKWSMMLNAVKCFAKLIQNFRYRVMGGGP